MSRGTTSCNCPPYLFETVDGDMIEIRIAGYHNGFNQVPATRWCIFHGWVEMTEQPQEEPETEPRNPRPRLGDLVEIKTKYGFRHGKWLSKVRDNKTMKFKFRIEDSRGAVWTGVNMRLIRKPRSGSSWPSQSQKEG